MHLVHFILSFKALAAIPSIDGEVVQQRLDHVRTYYELLNMPFEARFLALTSILFSLNAFAHLFSQFII